jgi:hypothetical protein
MPRIYWSSGIRPWQRSIRRTGRIMPCTQSRTPVEALGDNCRMMYPMVDGRSAERIALPRVS